MRRINCPKCGHNNLGEDNFCENCLANLVVVVPQDFFARFRGELQ